MHPILFRLFGFSIHSYGFMLMIGFILAIYVTTKRARLAGIKPDFITDLAIWAIVVGVVGARVAYIFEWRPAEEQKMFAGTWKVFDISDGNLSWIGGLTGLLLFVAVIMLNNRFGKKKIVLRGNGAVRKGATAAVVLAGILVALVCARAWAVGLWSYETLENGGTVEQHLYDDGTYNLKAFNIRAGGITFYGGFLPAALVIILLTLRRGYNVWKTADIIAPSVWLGLSFGRIGCFLNGCCWGKICEHGFFSNFAVRFPKIAEGGSLPFDSHLRQGLVKEVGDWTSRPVVPTQIISSLFAFALFLFLSWHISHKRNHGEVLAAGCALYSVGRFIVEFWRADNEPKWFGLTFSQNIGMGVFLLAAGFFIFLRLKKKARAEDKDAPEKRGLKIA